MSVTSSVEHNLERSSQSHPSPSGPVTKTFWWCWCVLWPLGVATLVVEKTPALCDG